MIQTTNLASHSVGLKGNYDLLHSPELTFLDYFNFKESQEESLESLQGNEKVESKTQDESTPICCGEALQKKHLDLDKSQTYL